MYFRKYYNKILLSLFTFFIFILSPLNANFFASTSDVTAFVTRFYQHCLGREPETEGLNNWVSSLNNGGKTGDELAQAFIFSDEFQSLNTSDSEFVTILYRAFFDREADAGGYNNWIGQLGNGASRLDVLNGFTTAQEFETLCENYGITASSASNDISVQGFVTRFYQHCLGREPDTGGLNNWVDSLNNGNKTGDELAQAFIFSNEFQNQNTSDSEFVTILYRAFFDREADAAGYNNWMNKLASGTSRSTILAGFTSAQEFITLCEYYGIMPSSPVAACIDLSGAKYSVTEIRNLQACGGPKADYDYYDAFTIQQNGCSATFLDSDNIWGTGTLSGNHITVTSSWYENGGKVNAIYDITIASDGSSFHGTGTGTWTDGYNSCQPNSTISGTRYE